MYQPFYVAKNEFNESFCFKAAADGADTGFLTEDRSRFDNVSPPFAVGGKFCGWATGVQGHAYEWADDLASWPYTVG